MQVILDFNLPILLVGFQLVDNGGKTIIWLVLYGWVVADSLQ